MSEFDFLDADQLRAVVRFQSEQNRAYRKLFIDGRMPSVVEVGKQAPELLMVDLEDMDVGALIASYREFESKYDTAPFDPAGERFRLFPGGVTIWSGFPGTGKTTILRQLVCQLLQRGRGVFVASLEEPPNWMLMRLWMVAAGRTDPDQAACEWFMHEYGDRLRLWGMVGLANFRAVLAAARYAIKHEGAQHVVIDSLTCLDVGGSDWDGQRGVANELCALAHSSGAHIHLVAHPRKPMKHDAGPDIADVAGSSDLGRLADNVLFVRRTDQESSTFEQATPMQVVVKKQRHGSGMCGSVDGWFQRGWRQFTREQYPAGPTRYLPDDAYRGQS